MRPPDWLVSLCRAWVEWDTWARWVAQEGAASGKVTIRDQPPARAAGQQETDDNG